MRILVKWPTRGRPQQFLKTLSGWLSQANDLSRISVLVSYDADDATMTPKIIAQAEKMHPALVAVKGNSKTKIMACNADVNEYKGDWDIILLVSDDMRCVRQGWDEIIRKKMTELYPDTDGCLWMHDNSKQRLICTLSCMGRAYYNRFLFIYNPEYSSFFCDNEYTDIARSLNKITFIENPIASHDHPSWQPGIKSDALYLRNNRYWRIDEAIYLKRKSEGFPK